MVRISLTKYLVYVSEAITIYCATFILGYYLSINIFKMAQEAVLAILIPTVVLSLPSLSYGIFLMYKRNVQREYESTDMKPAGKINIMALSIKSMILLSISAVASLYAIAVIYKGGNNIVGLGLGHLFQLFFFAGDHAQSGVRLANLSPYLPQHSVLGDVLRCNPFLLQGRQPFLPLVFPIPLLPLSGLLAFR